jgi:hypothetical protein
MERNSREREGWYDDVFRFRVSSTHRMDRV